MDRTIREYFASVGIEYFSVLDYSDCIETGTRIIERSGIEPRSVILYLLPYYTTETVNLSRYAVSLDYHLAIREINAGFEEILKEKFPEAKIKGYGDHSPIDERHAALISGLGIAGDNGVIINEKYGSYVFIGDVVTDISPEKLGAAPPKEILRCEHCGACKRACPTGILRGEGEDCLSAITQKKGDLTEEEAALMREYNTLWGCDICQSVCPMNKSAAFTDIAEFGSDLVCTLTPADIPATQAEFKRAYGERAFSWRGRAPIARNLELLYSEQ